MKYLRLFESFEEDIHKICNEFDIEYYTINTDGSIDVNNYVWLNSECLTELPLKFNKINGLFSCSNNQLISLEGSPKEVNGFFCHNNKLTSFQYAPKIIRGLFDCRNNNIKSFEYFPNFVHDLWCEFNPIYKIWGLFEDVTKIELLNDFDVFRDENTDEPAIVMDRLNDFLLTIGRPEVKKVDGYKNI